MSQVISDYSSSPNSAPLWRLSVRQYHDMIARGILSSADRVELLEGLLVEKMPKKPRHSFITQKLKDYLALVLPPGFFANAQEPITTPDSEPEPDLSIIRGDRTAFVDRHPRADEVAAIEVSDTTLAHDRGIKDWEMDPASGTLKVYTSPKRFKEIGAAGVLSGGNVLPVFSLGMKEWLELAGKRGLRIITFLNPVPLAG